MMLAYGRVPYNFEIMKGEEWPNKKQNASLCPLGQLPALVLGDGRSLVETAAIIHYVAKLTGVYPTNNEDAAFAHSIQEMCSEMNVINPICNWFPNESEKQLQEKVNFFDTVFPKFGDYCTTLLNDKLYFGGHAPHFGDFCLFHVINLMSILNPEYISSRYPLLAAWYGRMQSLPGVDEYLAERAKSSAGFPGSYLAAHTA